MTAEFVGVKILIFRFFFVPALRDVIIWTSCSAACDSASQAFVPCRIHVSVTVRHSISFLVIS